MKSKQELFDIICDNKVDIEFCEKIVWLRQRKEGLNIFNEPVGVKLNKYKTTQEAIEAGLKGLELL